MIDQRKPRRWKLKVMAAMVGGLAVLVVIFVHLSEPTVNGVVRRLRPGQTCAEAQEILKDADWSGPLLPDDGQSLFFADDEMGLVTMGGGRVVKVESQPDNGPFWERTRRTLERRWRAFEQFLRRRK